MDNPVMLASGCVSDKLTPLFILYQMNYPVVFYCMFQLCSAKKAKGLRSKQISLLINHY